ncbi:DNA polymerase bacteriophage-type [Proteiniborus sp. DW1]|uniref:uracil-DNA glycosylase n=1 Tax=Proteiniborus sp. DW1 TaxID=1889883 RepID=UPI00092DED14|nr:uracil-DNA glycosylase [Proteiniborus sp. DW1]SCG84503.1 DNA polymerase bacteriophage-type [Proteiniborus sp. DW1]
MKDRRLEQLNLEITNKFIEKELVLGNGRADSIIMMVGEAPGAREVEQKKPFVGSAGKYLNEFLSILELEREKLYITNTVKFRPTKEGKRLGTKTNRTPTKSEIEEFKEYLFEEIDIIEPKIIVTLGNIPLKTVLNDDSMTIGQIHGKPILSKIKEREYTIFPLYHPAAVIYKRDLKEIYLNDLNELKELLESVQMNE